MCAKRVKLETESRPAINIGEIDQKMEQDKQDEQDEEDEEDEFDSGTDEIEADKDPTGKEIRSVHEHLLHESVVMAQVTNDIELPVMKSQLTVISELLMNSCVLNSPDVRFTVISCGVGPFFADVLKLQDNNVQKQKIYARIFDMEDAYIRRNKEKEKADDSGVPVPPVEQTDKDLVRQVRREQKAICGLQQIALLVSLKQTFQVENVLLSDPAFLLADKAFLRSLQFEVSDSADFKTFGYDLSAFGDLILFMPYLPAAIFEQVGRQLRELKKDKTVYLICNRISDHITGWKGEKPSDFGNSHFICLGSTECCFQSKVSQSYHVYIWARKPPKSPNKAH